MPGDFSTAELSGQIANTISAGFERSWRRVTYFGEGWWIKIPCVQYLGNDEAHSEAVSYTLMTMDINIDKCPTSIINNKHVLQVCCCCGTRNHGLTFIFVRGPLFYYPLFTQQYLKKSQWSHVVDTHLKHILLIK